MQGRLALDVRVLLGRSLEAFHRLDEPTAKEASPDREIGHTVASANRLHAELRVQERTALRVGELPVNEHPADRAMHADLSELVHTVDEEVRLDAAEKRLLADGGHHTAPRVRMRS